MDHPPETVMVWSLSRRMLKFLSETVALSFPLTIDKKAGKHKPDHNGIYSQKSLLVDKSVYVSVLREEFQSSSC